MFFSKYIFVKRKTEKFKGAALKPYRSVSGHAPANFALTEQWFMLTTAHFALQSNFLRKLVCIRTTFLMKSLSLQH